MDCLNSALYSIFIVLLVQSIYFSNLIVDLCNAIFSVLLFLINYLKYGRFLFKFTLKACKLITVVFYVYLHNWINPLQKIDGSL